MAKNTLNIEYDYDFDLFGIISLARAYKLAWLINKQLGLHMVKNDDIHFSFLNDEKLIISNYLYETEYTQFRMLKNKSEENAPGKKGFLIPELNKFDYLIMKTGTVGTYKDTEMLKKIQEIKEIQYVYSLDIEKLKSRENLIF